MRHNLNLTADVQQTIVMAQRADDMQQGYANVILTVGLSFADFCGMILSDQQHAEREGLRTIEPGTGNDSKNQIQCYAVDAERVARIGAQVRAMRAYATLAARCAEQDVATVDAAMDASFAKLQTIDADLWQLFSTDDGAQLTDGVSASVLGIDGTGRCSGSVDKGTANRIASDDTASGEGKNGRAWRAMLPTGSVSARDIAAL